jgi:hypothetical protein
MNSEICEKLSVVCLGLFTVTTASTAGAGAIIVGGGGALLAVPALWRKYQDWSDCAEKRAVKQAAKAALKAWRDYVRNNPDVPAGSIAPAEAALGSVVDLIEFDPARLTEAQWNMAALPGLVVEAAASRSREFADPSPDPQAVHNRALLRFLAGQVVAALQAQPGFEASVMPAFRQDVIGQLAAIESKLDQVLAQKDVEAALLEARTQLKVTEGQLQAILEMMLKRGVEPDQFARALLEATANWLSANPRLQSRTGDNLAPELAALRQEAQSAYDRNEIEAFDEINDRIVALEEEAYARLQQDQRDLANQIAARKDLLIASLDERRESALAALNAEGAASAIARKLELEVTDPSALFDALSAVWQEWYERGRDKALNFDLEVSISLGKFNRDLASNANQRGVAQNNLGNALLDLGERENGTTLIREAIMTYRAALEEMSRERVPLEWAKMQNNLSRALTVFGERGGGTMHFEEAVAACHAALEEITRERVPLDWAATQINLGNALQALGECDSGIVLLEAAVAAFRAALEERSRERVPLDWARAKNSLGVALATIGQRETGTELLEEAVVAYREALDEWTRERAPLDWAMTQNNLGNALAIIGTRESSTARLEEAIAAYNSALREVRRPSIPHKWAMIQNNLGNALRIIGEWDSGVARLEEAIAAFCAALEERTRAHDPLDWALTQNNLGNALAALGERDSGTERLEQAVSAYRAALAERTLERVPFDWAQTRENMAMALKALFEKTGNGEYHMDALKAIKDALEVYSEAGAEFYIEKAERLLAYLEEQTGA